MIMVRPTAGLNPAGWRIAENSLSHRTGTEAMVSSRLPKHDDPAQRNPAAGKTDRIAHTIGMRMNKITMLATLALAAFATGCTYQPRFGFPIEQGSIESGRQVFIDFRCHACHTVSGVRLPELAGASTPLLELGGETGYIKAYSELVTSIINPNHRISELYTEQMRNRALAPLTSPMPAAHIDTMTVRQVIDLVAFLDSRYVLVEDYESDL